jgi:organic hydroperoxide reductase OsmC/OhrA
VSKVSADVVAVSANGYEARVAVRGHEITVDEPEVDGGGDRGPTPTELLLAAVASCYTLALRWAAARRGVSLQEIQVTATGTYENLRFASITLAVSADFPPGEGRPRCCVTQAASVTSPTRWPAVSTST